MLISVRASSALTGEAVPSGMSSWWNQAAPGNVQMKKHGSIVSTVMRVVDMVVSDGYCLRTYERRTGLDI